MTWQKNSYVHHLFREKFSFREFFTQIYLQWALKSQKKCKLTSISYFENKFWNPSTLFLIQNNWKKATLMLSLSHNWSLLVWQSCVCYGFCKSWLLWLIVALNPYWNDWECNVRQTDVWRTSRRCHVQFCLEKGYHS